ncbi:MAG: Asp-tRNA(Asn)/Glu-tRNA(Gln) amidotransferase subunit GatC [Gemmatimonadetes bacterium]|nr:Asp-tRNA(Asn)/Glu-tRNA(Gln) amidotransferase subunit GatC [Gemmatimonadota bacterium]
MTVSIEDVDHVASLAHLKFSDDEREQLVGQLNAILAYMEKLNTLDTSGVEPTSHVLNLKNVFRRDEIGPSLSQEEALRNAPSSDRGHFTVPKVI